MKDLIIIGAGPAGITAAIYAARKKMDFLIISKDYGGQMSLAGEVDNYPAIRNIAGINLSALFRDHLYSYGSNILFEEVTNIEQEKDFFSVITKNNSYNCKAIIIATGKKPKELDAKNADKFRGKGVSYCATCDAPLFFDSKVAIVGAGNSAMDATLQLSKYASKIYLIVRGEKPKADKYLFDKVIKLSNVEIMYKTKVKEVIGEDFVNSIKIDRDGKEYFLEVNGVFSEIGWIPNSSFVPFLKKNEIGEIIVDTYCKTSQEGIFAAGDVTNIEAKQIIVAAGQGAVATISAFNYLNKK
ncbi:MAG: FAD-dependent oxidoreductase [Candidatus Diapherotrites archaeon]|nr:FAD-dependent oxidoreductase [Candidatus Diapherotrites archaeon]